MKSLLIVLSVLLTHFNVGSATAQSAKVGSSTPKAWFIARVVDTTPFTLEYVDDWSRHQEPYAREWFDIDVEPQAHGENVDHFRLGDMVGGEHCYSLIHRCPLRSVGSEPSPPSPNEGMRLPSPVAINLKKLGNQYRRRYEDAGNLVEYKTSLSSLLIRSVKIRRDGRIVMNTDYAGGTSRRLSRDELRDLERLFVSSAADKIESKNGHWLGPSLMTVFGEFRSVELGDQRLKAFTDRLDELAEGLLNDAEYQITYRWRFRIKEWPYADILPLDLASDSTNEFLAKNRDRLAKIKAPAEFYEEARERHPLGQVNPYWYGYKGKLYQFSFATCTDNSTGSFGCFHTGEAGKRDLNYRVYAPFDEWPAQLAVRLADIPESARITNEKSIGEPVPIPKADAKRHRKFYREVMRRGGDFIEGDSVYSGVRVRIR